MDTVKFIKNAAGGALAEFVITIPFLLVFIFEVVNAGLIISAHHQINSIVNTGLLYAIRTPNDMTLIQTQLTSSSTLKPLTVSVTQFCQCSDGSPIACSGTCVTGGATPASFVTLNASTTVALAVPDIVFKNPYPVQGSATIRTK